jgi:hypothetical protein
MNFNQETGLFEPEKKSKVGKIILLIVVALLAILIVVFLMFKQEILELFGVKNNNDKFQYGDVNKDGVINSDDAVYVLQLVNGNKKIDEYTFLLADVDGDGKINTNDAQLILKKSTNLIDKFPVEEKKDNSDNENTDSNINDVIEDNKDNSDVVITPENEPVGGGSSVVQPPTTVTPQPSVEPVAPKPILYGDSDQDGIVTVSDARMAIQHSSKQITLTGNAFICADINGDNIVDDFDAEMILKYVVKKIDKLDPSVKYYTLGDIDNDGTITSTDANMILQYVNGSLEFEEVQKKAADYNLDGVINITDANLVLKTYVGK